MVRALGITLMTGLLAAALPPEEPVLLVQDLSIQGDWNLLSIETNSQFNYQGNGRDCTWKIGKDRIEYIWRTSKTSESYRLITNRSPAIIYLNAAPGIFMREGDILRVCMNNRSNVLPDRFDGKSPFRCVYILRRAR